MELDLEPATGPDPLADWRLPYLDCRLHEVLLTEKTEARWFARRAKSFLIIKGGALQAEAHQDPTTLYLN
jgi:hypothetical protein